MKRETCSTQKHTFDSSNNSYHVELESIQYVDEIEIHWNFRYEYKYEIEISLDSIHWVKLSKGEYVSSDLVSRNIIRANTGYIRIKLADQSADRFSEAMKHVLVYSGTAAEFIKGVDVSHLTQIEDFGGKFYDRQGRERDCLEILKEYGCNYVRLKVWNKPGLPNSDPAGYNDKAHVLGMAKRAVDKGYRLLIDFHYSDWWADPGKQFIPDDWKDLSLEQLNTALYDFTYEVLNGLKLQGTLPEMVQIGNEITNGMLWDVAKVSDEFDTPEQWDKLCTLLKSGISAVKAINESIRTVIHIERGGDNEKSCYFYDMLAERNVAYDIIGLSYYPIWHGPIKDFSSNIRDLYDRYSKEILVAEVAYPYTAENGDDQLNASSFPFTNIPEEYPPSIQSQADILQAVIYELKSIPDNKGIGFFYWQPDFIPVKGAGWKYGEGCEWDDQTLFDFKGNTLWSLDVFKLHS